MGEHGILARTETIEKMREIPYNLLIKNIDFLLFRQPETFATH